MMYVRHGNYRFCSLLGLLLVALAGLWPGVASASFPATQTPGTCTTAPCYEWQGNGWGATGWMAKLPACQADAANAQASSTVYNYVNPRVAASDADLKCYFDIVIRSDGSSAYPNSTDTMMRRDAAPVAPVYSCPANSTLSGSTCTCTAPNVQNGTNNGCEAPACVAGIDGFYRGAWGGNKVNPFSTCKGGCVHTVAPRLDLGVSYIEGPPASTYATYLLVRTTNTCTENNNSFPPMPPAAEDTTPTEPAPEPDCPAGQRRVYLADASPSCQPIPVDRFCPTGYTYGTVNGKDVCISQSGTTPTSSSPPTADKAPTVESKETTTEVANPDGTTTTTKKTSDGKGGGTETVTVKSADGKTIESTTKKTGEETGTCKPGTLGCMTSGTPTNGTLPANTVSVGTVAEHALPGFNIGNACPSDIVLNLAMAGTHNISFAGACDAAPMVKPLVLLAAAFMSLLIVYAALTAKSS